ncbi:MAG: hypothetical protein IKN05_10330, partial [Clostridia bacterium]|nr:hypothetical protein [Clostridia bacterium]
MTDENVLTTDADLAPGMTVAVYDGTLNSDNTVDGDVGYFRIVSDLGGGRYGYTGAEFTDVINVPHVFPLADDGSFDDGVVTVSAETLAFTDPIYKELGFDAGTRMRVGDFVYFYSGRPASVAELDERGVGRITDLAPEGDGLRVAYDPATMNDIHTSADMYVKIPQLDIPLNDYDQEGIRQAMLRQVEESGFVESAGQYVTGLICGEEVLPDDPEMADALKKMTFNTDDGGEMSLDELRALAGGASRVEVSNPEVSFKLSLGLEHFHGTGIRAVVTAGFTISIALNGNNKIEIQLVAALEQEIVLGVDVNVETEWDVIILKEVTIDASARAGTFTGFGAQATVMTKSDNPSEDAEWTRLLETTGANLGDKNVGTQLLDMGTKLETMSKNLDKVQNGGTASKSRGQAGAFGASGDHDGPEAASAGGDLPEKYSAMLDNDAEYINLVE